MIFLEQLFERFVVWKVTEGQCSILLFFEKKVQEKAKEQEAETWRRLIILGII